ncbi:MAG: peptidase S41 [Aureispira sp.]|nr:peptidase S41 [Aureispira sp.]
MRLLLAVLILWTSTLSISYAQDAPLWLRYSAISPDGKTVVFSYKGDLYKVASSGGTATALTMHAAHDYMPIWSNDSKTIAFASNRYGNFDVYSMSIEGGSPTRLTFHSSNDLPTDFSPKDDHILFQSLRIDDSENRLFPSGRLPELYSIPSKGGQPKQVLTIPAERAQYSQKGDKIIYHDRKGYEDEFRKHHTSSVTRDLWVYDNNKKTYTQLTTFAGEDRNPLYSKDEKTIFYLSEKSGTFNVHALQADKPTETRQVTKLTKHPVRHLSISTEGTLCFSYNGELYTLKDGAEPQKINIKIFTDDRYNEEKIVSATGRATDMAVSPNGKEVAYIIRGEVFVSSVEGGMTKRITNTAEQERSVSFSPDGKAILYASERDQSWNLYQTKLAREEETYFFNSTILKEEAVLVSNDETFQPSYSPDGKEVAFLHERTELKVINLASKGVRTVLAGNKNYSYSDGDQYYQWSPDSKWFLVEFLRPQQWIGEVGLIKADGIGKVINLSKSGYNEGRPQWAMDGKMVIWASDRDGMKNHASWGGQYDIYGLFFTQDGYDKFRLSKEEYALLKEEEKKDKKEPKKEEKEEKDDKSKDKKNKKGDKADKTDKDTKEDTDDKDKVKDLEFELDNIKDRKVRLTIHSSSISDFVLSKDGEKLYYLAKFEKGYDLWETNVRTRETKILVKLKSGGGGLQLSKDGKFLFFFSRGKIKRIELSNKKQKPIGMKGEMVLKRAAERDYLFEHMWRQVVKKFYLKDLHGVDWDFYKKEYARFLPHINNGHDYAEMMSELLGELNASHTGCRYRPSSSGGDQTASLGIFYDASHTGKGIKIKEIMPQSPLIKKSSKIKAGTVIEKIDGVEITADLNYNKLLNRKEGKYTLLSLFDASSGERWEEVVKPIGRRQEFNLRYKRWIENCKAITEKVSGGRIGYVHVKGMNNESFKAVYEEALGENFEKEAIIVDTRFNGGGWLHDDLATFLSGTPYLKMMPRGQDLGREPMFKWYKPSAVLMGESNYSDAHMFPYVYKALNVGKLVGMPVPGTATAVWWERLQNGMVFGIPQIGMVTNDGKYLENTQLEPDIKVAHKMEEVTKGKDAQIEAAVKDLLKQLDKK